MTASLMFTRDGRTLAFVPVTAAALAAIEAVAVPRRLAYARSLYLALLECANEDRSDRAVITRKSLAKRAGCSVDLVSDLRTTLEDAGVVVVIERSHGGQRLEHEWVVVEPGQGDELRAGSSDPHGSQPPPLAAANLGGGGSQPQQLGDEEKNGRKDEYPPTPEDEFPAEMPEELTGVAIAAGKVLKRAALARGQGLAVTRRAVGHAVLSYPDRDHLKRALDLENWLLNTSKGRRARCADIVQRWRHFLDDSDPMARAPQTPAQPSASPDSLRDMAAHLRSQGQ